MFSRNKDPSTNAAIVTTALAQSSRKAHKKQQASASTSTPPSTDKPGSNVPPASSSLLGVPEPTLVHPQRFPWSTNLLTFLPGPPLMRWPRLVIAPPAPSRFSRYRHSLPITATADGELYLFGGLHRQTIRDDLYLFSTRDLTVARLRTDGDLPSPRVRHAIALRSTVLVIWGGDTMQDSKFLPSDMHDDALYLLNLKTHEWTKVETCGERPTGRYGHAVAMVGTKFFVFAGQRRGQFFNDLWVFDLNALKAVGPIWEEYLPAAGGARPPARTGHVCVAFKDTIYLFGGTDGQFHYNDTWAFDTIRRTWLELNCIGHIPAAREDHAAALVDGVIYIFGGRGVDGKDLSDLGAFRISDQRWFMLQNMGPAPSGRSGHAMASWGTRVFILGGESFDAKKQDPTNILHVLDTKNIKYPDHPKAARRPLPAIPPVQIIPLHTHKPASIPALMGLPSPQQARPVLVPETAAVTRSLGARPPRSVVIVNPRQFANQDIDRRSSGAPPTQSVVLVNPMQFTTQDVDRPPPPGGGSIYSNHSSAVPDLTGRINIIKGPLRGGGFCDIFLGKFVHEHGDTRVAMKMLRVFDVEAHVLKIKKKFRKEVSLWRLLHHDHVLPFYGTCELDEFRLFMISPWAEGGSSLEYIRRYPSTHRGRLLGQTASALAYLHSGKDAPQIVHGDLKADNVLISATGDALLADFGLSRYVEEIVSGSGGSASGSGGSASGSSSSSAGRAGGHPRFMAPELLMPPETASRASQLTPQTDVFAFASLMLQIYTEELPFGNLHEVQVILKIISGELPPRPEDLVIAERGCDDYIWSLMLHCWNFRPSDRPSMDEVQKRITELQRSS